MEQKIVQTIIIKFHAALFKACYTYSELNERLISASESGQIYRVKVLLSAGADIHSHNDDSLKLAGFNGHSKVIIALLESGADANVFSENALRMLEWDGHKTAARIIRKSITSSFSIS